MECGRRCALSSCPRRACALRARPRGARVCRAGAFPRPSTTPWSGSGSGPGPHLVHYPVRGGEDLNIVAVIAGGAGRQGWSEPGSAANVLASFALWTKDAKSLLERAETWRGWSLYRLTGLKRWSAGPVTLLGDAAHPVLPYLAQGAALAIEDAVALAASLASAPGDPPQPSSAMRNCAGPAPRAFNAPRAASAFSTIWAARWPRRAIPSWRGGAKRQHFGASTGSMATKTNERRGQAVDLPRRSTALPANADSNEPASTASLVMASCSASGKGEQADEQAHGEADAAQQTTRHRAAARSRRAGRSAQPEP